jgi:hypothetical protein
MLTLNAAGVGVISIPVTTAVSGITLSGGHDQQQVTLLFVQDGTGHSVTTSGGNLQGFPTVSSSPLALTAGSLVFNATSNTWVCTASSSGGSGGTLSTSYISTGSATDAVTVPGATSSSHAVMFPSNAAAAVALGAAGIYISARAANTITVTNNTSTSGLTFDMLVTPS